MKTHYESPTCSLLSVETLLPLCFSGLYVTTDNYLINDDPESEIKW